MCTMTDKKGSKPSEDSRVPVAKSDNLPLQSTHSPKKKYSVLKRVVLWMSVFFIIIVGIFSYRIVSIGKEVIEGDENISIITQIKNLVIEDDTRLLKGEEENRINILLLGLGGEGHLGGGNYLTDTIILLSIRPDDNSVSMISIPRDRIVVRMILAF